MEIDEVTNYLHLLLLEVLGEDVDEIKNQINDIDNQMIIYVKSNKNIYECSSMFQDSTVVNF